MKASMFDSEMGSDKKDMPSIMDNNNCNNRLAAFGEKLNTINHALEAVLPAVSDAAFFSNASKNGLHYQFSPTIILTSIFTGQIIAVSNDDISLAPHLVLKGEWEMELTRACESMVAQMESPIIFDVGANFGWYGLTLSRLDETSSIHFFEANPRLIEPLQKTSLVNGISTRSRINNCAVSNTSRDKVFLKIPSMHKGSASLHSFNVDISLFHESLDEVETVEVETITIDEYCLANSLYSINFLKIDVEGAEADVLLGARKTIERSSSLVVFMEWNCSRYPDSLLGLLALFDNCTIFSRLGSQVDLTDLLHSCPTIREFEEKVGELIGDQGKTFFDIFLRRGSACDLASYKNKDSFASLPGSSDNQMADCDRLAQEYQNKIDDLIVQKRDMERQKELAEASLRNVTDDMERQKELAEASLRNVTDEAELFLTQLHQMRYELDQAFIDGQRKEEKLSWLRSQRDIMAGMIKAQNELQTRSAIVHGLISRCFMHRMKN